jgi:hypothetical protein
MYSHMLNRCCVHEPTTDLGGDVVRRRRRTAGWIAGALFGLLAVVPCNAEPFVFQAVLSHAGTPVSGAYDLRFRLWDDPTAGNQVGSEVVVEDRVVEAGRVTEVIDPGAPPGSELCWLEIAVREHDSTGAFTVIGGRKPLNPTPLANRSVRASSAPQASNALSVGQPGAHFLEWSNLTDVPADLADGDDDALGGLACSDGEVAKQTGGTWGCAEDQGQVFSRTWVVGPVGDPLANGVALLAALAAIPTPNAAHEAQLVKLEPGRYDLGTSSLELRPWISLEGSGRSTTVIASAVCASPLGPYPGVVEAAADTEIGSLTIENMCSEPTEVAIGLRLDAGRVRVVDVLVRCNGTTSYAAAIEGNGIGLELVDVDARAYESTIATGIELSGTATLKRVASDVRGSTDGYAGLFIDAESVRIEDCWFRASAESATSFSYALQVRGDAILERSTMISVNAWVTTGLGVDLSSCGSPPCHAQLNHVTVRSDRKGVSVGHSGSASATLIIRDSHIIAGESGVDFYGGIGASIDVRRSRIHGTFTSCTTTSTSGPVRITGTQLSGGPVVASSPVHCAGVWDENFVFSASGCP